MAGPSNNNIGDRITDKIHEELLSIISKEELEEKVSFEIERFFTYSKDQYGRTEKSRFGQIVEEILAKETRAALQSMLQTPEWKIALNEQNQAIIGDTIKKILDVDATALTTTLARAVAMQNAKAILGIVGMALSGGGHSDIGSYISNMMPPINA